MRAISAGKRPVYALKKKTALGNVSILMDEWVPSGSFDMKRAVRRRRWIKHNCPTENGLMAQVLSLLLGLLCYILPAACQTNVIAAKCQYHSFCLQHEPMQTTLKFCCSCSQAHHEHAYILSRTYLSTLLITARRICIMLNQHSVMESGLPTVLNRMELTANLSV